MRLDKVYTLHFVKTLFIIIFIFYYYKNNIMNIIYIIIIFYTTWLKATADSLGQNTRAAGLNTPPPTTAPARDPLDLSNTQAAV